LRDESTGKDNLGLLVDDGLGVESIVEKPVSGLHDARLGIVEVALGLCWQCCLFFCLLERFGNLILVGTGTLGLARSLVPARSLASMASMASRIFAWRVSRRARPAGASSPPVVRAEGVVFFAVSGLCLGEGLAHLGPDLVRSSCS
jgi:hypothetical protein